MTIKISKSTMEKILKNRQDKPNNCPICGSTNTYFMPPDDDYKDVPVLTQSGACHNESCLAKWTDVYELRVVSVVIGKRNPSEEEQ